MKNKNYIGIVFRIIFALILVGVLLFLLFYNEVNKIKFDYKYLQSIYASGESKDVKAIVVDSMEELITINDYDKFGTYDEAYFEKNILILVYLIEPTSSVSHEIKDIVWDGKGDERKIKINIKRSTASLSNDMMSSWCFVIEPKEGLTHVDETDLDITILDFVY